jgi:hypothetical protein
VNTRQARIPGKLDLKKRKEEKMTEETGSEASGSRQQPQQPPQPPKRSKAEKALKKRKVRMIKMAPGRAAYVAEFLELIAPLVRHGVPLKFRMHPFRNTCGAKTRCGEPCRCFALANGRCRLHGGLSTGPKTAEGLARTREGYAAWRERQRASKGTHPEKT